jgi:nucleotide-binding universal stress UspA family protein
MATPITSQLKHILLATDFSPRSDRAGRRAALLANQFGAKITVVHVVDDVLPVRLTRQARKEASELLDELRGTLKEIDGIDCDVSVKLGEAFAGILSQAGESGTDLIVIGPHRREILKDTFIGTTAERTIRGSRVPTLMANGMPAGSYRNVLVATDLSEHSAAALRACQAFGFGEAATTTVLYVFDAPAKGYLMRASSTEDEISDYVSEERERAETELHAFLRHHRFEANTVMLRPNDLLAAAEIKKAAVACAADLIVVGTSGRTGVAKAFLGSVAEKLLGACEKDVLVVPVRQD